jgi:hypothetical protein
VCQVHAAVCPQLTFWWHDLRVPRFIIDDIAKALHHHQNNRKNSRHSHRKQTILRYHQQGIYLNETIKCHWPDG